MIPGPRSTPDFRPEAEPIDDRIAFWLVGRMPGILAAIALGSAAIALLAHAIRLVFLLARSYPVVDVVRSVFPYLLLLLFTLVLLLIGLKVARGRSEVANKGKSPGPARSLEPLGSLWDRDLDGGA